MKMHRPRHMPRASSPTPTSWSAPERRYRPELHGLRGLAILGVVLFHLFGAGRISGGIDIFLAISGFLFTSMLLREAVESGGTIQVGRYLARLTRRLLPAAALVIAVTTLAGFLLLPDTRHGQLLSEARASLLYFENLELINSQLGYDAAGPDSSPFQHFWSLSVQGQFYLVWPLVALVAVAVARRLHRSPIVVMGAMVGVILVSSFSYAVFMGGINQDEAYLMTRTRMWELCFGGLLALAGARIAVPQRWRMPLGWAGVALIASTGFVFEGAEVFPGPFALWPLLGLALVLAAAGPQGGASDASGSATWVLSRQPFTWVGDHAYALYLWHWPLLVFFLELTGEAALDAPGAVMVLLASFTLAIATRAWVEKPVAAQGRSRTRAPLALAASMLLLGGSATSYGLYQIDQRHGEAPSLADLDRDEHPGALSTLSGIESPSGVSFIPDPQTLSNTRPDYYGWGCRRENNDGAGGEVLTCEDPERPSDPDLTVLITGGSHAGQWHHAWRIIAAENNWELLIADMSGCVLTHPSDPQLSECHEWNQGLLDLIEAREPDLVFSAGTRVPNDDSEENIPDGAPEQWQSIMDLGADLLLMRGTPRGEASVADCLAEGGDGTSCGMDPASYRENNPLADQEIPKGVYSLDLTAHLCEAEVCPAVIGNIAVYYDHSHLSNHYVESMAPILDAELRDEMPHLF